MKARVCSRGKKRMRKIGRDRDFLRRGDVAICASNRQLSLKPFRATAISLARPVSPTPVVSLRLHRRLSRSLRCHVSARATVMSVPEVGVQFARGACERGMHRVRAYIDAGSERGRSPGHSRVSRIRSHIHALCHAKNCRWHIGCGARGGRGGGPRARRKFLSCV